MADFLLELLSEEIPARMQAKATVELERLFRDRVGEAGLAPEIVETYATPRRLALIARALPTETAAASEELKGPRVGASPQAIEGFLRKTGLAANSLVERDGVYFAFLERPGRSTCDVLAEVIPAILRAFPWPKSMRWGAASAGAESLRWVRPLQGIVALFGEQIVDFEIAGVHSGAATLGHRFHHPGTITIGSAGDYVEKLRACHVILDPAERRQLIADGARQAASDAGLKLVEDEGLLQENAGLTEWPVPLLGTFDPGFLEVPSEVIQLTMRTNQKYFALLDAQGKLAPNFVCVANILASDNGVSIAEGNRKVLAARLADAKFFWEHDLKVPLEQRAAKLEQIIFHEKLGTVADKVERVMRLAKWLVQERIVRRVDMDSIQRAARLAKADLLSEIVGEFPELQGTLGGYLARAQGEPEAVVLAIRDHYKPAGQADDAPQDPVTATVNIADRIDTLVAFFSIGEKPTGSRDPFALRRAALGLLQILGKTGLRLPLRELLIQSTILLKLSRLGALKSVTFPDLLDEDEGDHQITAEVGSFTYRFGSRISTRWNSALTPKLERGQFIEEVIEVVDAVMDFFADRLKVQQREAGIRHDLIDAVFALGDEDDLVRLLARVQALQAFVESPQGADLLAGYKRAANILKKENWNGRRVDRPGFTYSPLTEEATLDEALDVAEPRVEAAIAEEDFERAMKVLSGLRNPVDDFFDKVTVNDPDPAKRESRLNLLARIREAVHRVADFSKIEG